MIKSQNQFGLIVWKLSKIGLCLRVLLNDFRDDQQVFFSDVAMVQAVTENVLDILFGSPAPTSLMDVMQFEQSCIRPD